MEGDEREARWEKRWKGDEREARCEGMRGVGGGRGGREKGERGREVLRSKVKKSMPVGEKIRSNSQCGHTLYLTCTTHTRLIPAQ